MGKRINSFQHPVTMKRLLRVEDRAIRVDDEKGPG